MDLIIVPNLSEGRDRSRIASFERAVSAAGARTLDTHTDAVHNRSVLTIAGDEDALIAAAAALAVEASAIDLRRHSGVHPRLGGLDVCPFVPHDATMDVAVGAARRAAAAIAARSGLPVYLYGHAASPPRELPDLRRGGLQGLIERSGSLPPDFGPSVIDPRAGVVCVGARGPLIAFNIWMRCDLATARAIAKTVRAPSGGSPGVRALGLSIDDATCQVSMNLTKPDRTGIDDVFAAVARAAAADDAEIFATEIVGLPPERYLPDPESEAARLLMQPGRSLERFLAS